MNNTESWKKYVPETVSLYHVDYRENLDEREDLQEQSSGTITWRGYMKQSWNVMLNRKRKVCSKYLGKSKRRWQKQGKRIIFLSYLIV